MTVHVTQLVYVRAGREHELHAFEDTVLPLLARYGGELVLRLRPPATAKVAGSAEPPYEVHVVTFPDEDALARFSADPERARVLHLKDSSVERIVTYRG